MTMPLQKERKKRLRAARGRGNQADHAPRQGGGGELAEHKDWNAQVDAEKRRKGKKVE